METRRQEEKGDGGDGGEERGDGRADLLFVTRVCVNPSSVSLLCPSVYKRPGEGDDVLPPVTVHLLSSIRPAPLLPFPFVPVVRPRRCSREMSE